MKLTESIMNKINEAMEISLNESYGFSLDDVCKDYKLDVNSIISKFELASGEYLDLQGDDDARWCWLYCADSEDELKNIVGNIWRSSVPDYEYEGPGYYLDFDGDFYYLGEDLDSNAVEEIMDHAYNGADDDKLERIAIMLSKDYSPEELLDISIPSFSELGYKEVGNRKEKKRLNKDELSKKFNELTFEKKLDMFTPNIRNGINKMFKILEKIPPLTVNLRPDVDFFMKIYLSSSWGVLDKVENLLKNNGFSYEIKTDKKEITITKIKSKELVDHEKTCNERSTITCETCEKLHKDNEKKVFKLFKDNPIEVTSNWVAGEKIIRVGDHLGYGFGAELVVVIASTEREEAYLADIHYQYTVLDSLEEKIKSLFPNDVEFSFGGNLVLFIPPKYFIENLEKLK